MTEAEIRDALVAETRTWIGTPYAPYGRTKGVGADCIFFEAVGRAVLGTRNRYRSYPLVPRGRLIEQYADRDLLLIACARDRTIRFSDFRPARLALFHGRNPEEPQHFGMLAVHPKFPDAVTLIHAYGSEPRGKVIEATLTSREEWGRPGAVRSFTGRLWKLYEIPEVVA